MLLLQQAGGQDANNTFRFLEVKKKLSGQPLAMHGLLGQRVNLDDKGSQSLSIDVHGPAMAMEQVQGKQGEGFIQGHFSDYQEKGDDLFGCGFSYNLHKLCTN